MNRDSFTLFSFVIGFLVPLKFQPYIKFIVKSDSGIEFITILTFETFYDFCVSFLIVVITFLRYLFGGLFK